jgi:hypothetical protein
MQPRNQNQGKTMTMDEVKQGKEQRTRRRHAETKKRRERKGEREREDIHRGRDVFKRSLFPHDWRLAKREKSSCRRLTGRGSFHSLRKS